MQKAECLRSETISMKENNLLFCEENSAGIKISETTLQDLNIDQIIRAIQEGDSFYQVEAMYRRFPKTKREEQYRRDIFQALKGDSSWEVMNRFSEDMKQAHQAAEKEAEVGNEVQKRAWHLNGAFHYCRAVESLWELVSAEAAARAEGLKKFGQYLEEYKKGETYTAMCGRVDELADVFYRSPIVLSVQNNKMYVDWDTTKKRYDRRLQSYFTEEKRQCRSPFLGTPQMSELELEIISILEKKNPEAFQKLESFYQDYPEFLDETIVRFEKELQYYRLFLKFMRSMEKQGLSFATPLEREETAMSARGLYDLALAYQNRHYKSRVVENDFYYGTDEFFFVINGPNQGGKTTFARSVGQLVYFAKMGFDVPAKSANVHFYQTILTHFSAEESVLTGKGKLKEELERMEPLMRQTEEPAFVILNELFTTAANYDARIMGKRVLDFFMGKGCRGVYVTHLEDLEQISEKIVPMKAAIDEDGHRRTYKIERGKIASFGYAGDIVEKHRLTYGQLKELLKGGIQ